MEDYMIQWSELCGIYYGLAYHPDEPSENKLFACYTKHEDQKKAAELRLTQFMRSKRLDPRRAEGRTVQEMLSAS